MRKILLNIENADDYNRGLIKGIISYGKTQKWSFTQMPISAREKIGTKGFISWIKKWNPDGIIVQIENKRQATLFKELTIPTICTDFKERHSAFTNVTGGYIETGLLAATYFIEKGFSNFGYYGFSEYVWSRERGDGFAKTIKEKGYTLHRYNHPPNTAIDIWFYDQEKVLEWLLNVPKPIGIFCCDDTQAHHIKETCQNNEIHIPQEVAILGVDNDETKCHLSEPFISSIALNTYKGGYKAAQELHSLMEEKNIRGKNIIVEPTHVVTRSTTDIIATSDEYVSEAIKYMHENYNKDISVDKLLEKIPLSRRAFEKRFKKVCATPIYQYLTSYRLQKLAELLLTTNESLKVITHKTGLKNAKNISRSFKKIYKLSPYEYRKKHSE